MSHTITSEMTASVFKIAVEVGAHVEEGDELVILESMKMEIPVLADAAGTVAEIHVSEGESINEGSAVATLDP